MLVLLSGAKPVGRTVWISKARRRRRTSASRYSTPVMGTDADDVQRIIERGVQQARDGVKSTRLRRAIEMRSADEIIAAVPLEPLMAMTNPLANVYGKQIVRGANRQVDEFGRADTFNAADARVINAAGLRAGNLVTRITQEQRASLRGAIVDAASGQFSVDDTARIIRSSIGLTTRYENAVKNNYFKTKQALISAGMGERAAAETASKSAEKYAARLTRSRARTIARTELHQSNNIGRQLAWDELVQEGFIGPDQYKVWVANPSACSICLELDGESVPMNEPFSNGDLQAEAHPNCMCIAELETLTERDAREEAERQGTAETEPETTFDATPTSKTEVETFDDVMNELDELRERRDEIEKELAMNGNPADHQDTLGLAMNEKYGLDGKPQVVSADEFDAMMKGREDRTMYRAVTSGNVSQEQVFEQFKGGEFSARQGTYGDGTYFAARGAAVPSSLDPYVRFQGQREVIGGYGGADGLVMRAAFKPDARLISFKDLNEEINKLDLEAVLSAKAVREQFAERQRRGEGTFESLQPELEAIEKRNYDARVALASQGHAARMLGYDGILVEEVGYVVVINRGSVIVQGEPDYNRGKGLRS